MKTKHEMRQEAIKRLKETVPYNGFDCYKYTIDGAIAGVFVDIEGGFNVDNVRKCIIDLLTDDEIASDNNAFSKGPRDADGILWFRGDMSDSEWGVIEKPHFDGDKWMIRGHDISAPWVPADSIRHASMRTATQREDDLVDLLRDAVGDYESLQADCRGIIDLKDTCWQKFKDLHEAVDERYIELPRDANGEVIHIGDKITYHGLCARHQGKVLEVKGIMSLSDGIDAVLVYDTKLVKLYANNCRHYHKPSVEDVLREFAHVGIRIGAENGIQLGKVNLYADEEMIEKFAKKLQLKEETCE